MIHLSYFIALFTLMVAILTIRSILIVIGIYKDPVLGKLSVYGEENIYVPALNMLLWSTIMLLLFIGFIVDTVAYFILILVFMCMIFIFYNSLRNLVLKYLQELALYPKWYQVLMMKADRDERRRIAYLWLNLPLRLRLVYSTNDHLFEQWTDLVLMSIA
ncbi:hypothetical protein MASR2M15_06770 [Anaerolineales bacterium]